MCSDYDFTDCPACGARLRVDVELDVGCGFEIGVSCPNGVGPRTNVVRQPDGSMDLEVMPRLAHASMAVSNQELVSAFVDANFSAFQAFCKTQRVGAWRAQQIISELIAAVE